VAVPGVQNRFPGAQASDRFQFPLRKVLNIVGVIVVLFLLAALLLPAKRSAREAARRNQCINNLKNLGLSLHNHQDIHGRLPLASSEPRTGRPGIGTGPNPAGYSWIVGLLPFMEEVALWDAIADATNNTRIPPFDPAGKPELSCANIQILRCPSYGGPERVRTTNNDYQEYATPKEKVGPASSNYVALAASHFTHPTGLGLLFDSGSQQEVSGNGLLAFLVTPGRSINKGLSFKTVSDGTSKTVVLAESKEQAYNAWIDGQATWVIGAWQGDSNVPSKTGAADGMLGWPHSDTTSRTALNVGSRVQEAGHSRHDPVDKIYLTAERYGAGHDRVWGPSSEHTGGAVNHVFADGHVTSITPDIDRNVYLRIISRDGGEAVTLD
jgi:prepilin-type processing-associated H-X9-DG protein